LGESATPDVIASVENLLSSEKRVHEWCVHFGPLHSLLVVEIDLVEGLSLQEAEETMGTLREEIRKKEPKIKQVHLQTRSLEKS
jgi:divalent metal cation (Fe/Co/Zn/Cd) transporter